MKLWMLGFGFDMSERMSEDMSERMSKDMSEKLSEDMSERVSNDLSERMSKDMSERCQKEWSLAIQNRGCEMQSARHGHDDHALDDDQVVGLCGADDETLGALTRPWRARFWSLPSQISHGAVRIPDILEALSAVTFSNLR